jgi:uncharacterized protein (TIGR00251 family)
VIVIVKVTPRARRETIEAPGPDAALRVRVMAPANDGKANAALIALLAEAWDLPKSTLSIAGGQTSRLKRILVRGDPAVLLQRLSGHIATP